MQGRDEGAPPGYERVAPGVSMVGAKLEALTPNARVREVVSGSVTVIDGKWHGSNAVTLRSRDDVGNVAQTLLNRNNEPSFAVEKAAGASARAAIGPGRAV